MSITITDPPTGQTYTGTLRDIGRDVATGAYPATAENGTPGIVVVDWTAATFTPTTGQEA